MTLESQPVSVESLTRPSLVTLVSLTQDLLARTGGPTFALTLGPVGARSNTQFVARVSGTVLSESDGDHLAGEGGDTQSAW